jgi:hypothetical protein
VPVRGDLSGNRGFFDCHKSERLLGWKHYPMNSASPKFPKFPKSPKGDKG